MISSNHENPFAVDASKLPPALIVGPGDDRLVPAQGGAEVDGHTDIGLEERVAIRSLGSTYGEANLYLQLGRAERDDAGTFRLNGGQAEQASNYLEPSGAIIPAESYTPQVVQAAIRHGQEQIHDGTAQQFLRDLSFVDDRSKPQAGDNTKSIFMSDHPLILNPRYIVGAQAFTSWQGRGEAGSGEVHDRQQNTKSRSIDRIIEYAGKDTQLPAVNDMTMFLTRQGNFFYAGNSHRAAAAQLRGEPLRASAIYLSDLRHTALSARTQREIDQAILTVRSNLEKPLN